MRARVWLRQYSPGSVVSEGDDRLVVRVLDLRRHRVFDPQTVVVAATCLLVHAVLAQLKHGQITIEVKG